MALGPPVATKLSGFAVGFCGDRRPSCHVFHTSRQQKDGYIQCFCIDLRNIVQVILNQYRMKATELFVLVQRLCVARFHQRATGRANRLPHPDDSNLESGQDDNGRSNTAHSKVDADRKHHRSGHSDPEARNLKSGEELYIDVLLLFFLYTSPKYNLLFLPLYDFTLK